MTTALSLYTEATITASTLTRTLAGDVVRFGVPGRTSRGKLRVRPGALRFPPELRRVKLTREHDREDSRGHLADLVVDDQRIRAALRVSDGPEGDAALREAADGTRDGLSFDVIDATIEGDEITDGLVIAIGQVGIPAYDDSRIDTIAASQTPAGDPGTTQGDPMSTDQPAEVTTTTTTTTPAPAPQPEPQPDPDNNGTDVAASLSAVPAGVPSPAPARTSQSGALDAFVSTIVTALRPGGGGSAAITAALTDVTHTQHTGNIEAPAWSGELWSGLQYEPEFTGLLNSGSLTNWEGRGWRFTQKPVIADYAGDKAAIPSGAITTEDSTYEAARMAVGHDIDRKFYDFPNEGFLRAYVEAVRESWAIKLDGKVRDFIVANAVPVTTADGADVGTDPDVVAESSLLKAVARGFLALRRARVGRGTFVVMNDEDWFDLFDVTSQNKPAFLDLFNVNPSNFVSTDAVGAGTVIVGVKQAATVRTLPGSPIRVDAQNIANGGVDNGFFGYWAVEQHHTGGIVSVEYDPA